VFGKESKPAQTAGGHPYVSGLTPNGRLLAQAGAHPVVFASPLVAWRPVLGATGTRSSGLGSRTRGGSRGHSRPSRPRQS
jgi:hypothetical protein